MSTNTGFAPNRMHAIAQEIIVKEGITTSSPGFTPKANNAVSKAAVPLQTAIPCFTPRKEARFFSNLRTNGPSEETHPVSTHFFKYFASLPDKENSLIGIIF
jgi:hypothetical protein